MWSPDEPVQIVDRESIAVTLPEGLTNPFSRVRQLHEWVVEHSDSDAPLLDWLDVYEGHQVMGFAAAPLAMSTWSSRCSSLRHEFSTKVHL